ncbi:DUF421 domain-containing protein [Oscillibacter sp. MSJ-2]|uniref:DUF421 domain-containing protein n=1 Tax=Dysosmobacter acutus TaxID=2841504 RepID=A0ABS6F9N0_9FIRM|nr:DUF421 domain-containing protein [Dysosmobacter acutus]MBU5626991.1 DUF421 domain-containing protein [Dysosmobacter acutus]
MSTAFLRTVILYLMIMLGLRLTGKRQIGQLEPAELALTMMISDLATVPMQDFGIPLLAGVIPILTLLALSTLFSYCSLKSLRFRAFVCGTPAILIEDGRICQDVLRKNRFTLDELIEELRGQGIGDLSTVKYAILENSGQLSVLPYPANAPVTPRDMGITPASRATLPVILINDGRVMTTNLNACGKSANWLHKELKKHKLRNPSQVFLLTLDQEGTVCCIPKEDN